MAHSGSRLRAILLSSGAPHANNGHVRPNWAHAFHAVLEKRGFEIDLRSRWELPVEKPADLVVVCPTAEPLAANSLPALRLLGIPVVIEANALDDAARAELGLAVLPVSGEGCMRYRDAAAVAALAPFETALGGQPGCHPIGPVQVRERYVPPDPLRFRIAADDAWPDMIAKIGLRQVFAWRQRWAKNGFSADIESVDKLGALALAIAALRLAPGAHRTQLLNELASIGDEMSAAESPHAAVACRLIANWTQAAGASPLAGHALLAELFEACADEPLICKARTIIKAGRTATPNAVAWPGPVVEAITVAGVMASDRREDFALLLSGLCQARLDLDKGAFFDLDLRTGRRSYRNHPLVTAILVGLAPSLVLNDWNDASTASPSARALALWAEPPARPILVPDVVPDVLLAEFVTEGETSVPAIWQDGSLIVLGYPALSLIGHAQTLPPLPLPLEDGNLHWALLLEHALMSMLAARSERIARQSCPGSFPRLVVRHDVDRPIDSKTFSRLMNAYARRGARSTWYWIHDRLDADQMKALVAAGHEVALHGLRTIDKRQECQCIEAAADCFVVGESYHGSGADYHIGAASAMAAGAVGFLHSELSPLSYDLNACAFPFVDEEGRICFMRGCGNVTFAYSTDAMSTSRKQSVAGDPEFALSLLRGGYPVCVLNHPDMNFERLMDFLDQAEAIGVSYATAQEVAAEAQRNAAPDEKGDRSMNARPLDSFEDLRRIAWRNSSLPFQPKGVFIIGAPRTGSTLLNNLLATNPAAMPAIPEITPFISIVEAYRKAKRLDATRDGAFFGSEAAVDRLFSDFLERIVDDLLTRYGGELAILKSPFMSKYFLELTQLLPDFVFLCTVRHPALIVRSMREWGRKAAARGVEHAYATLSDEELYKEIQGYYAPVFKLRVQEKARRLRFVRYEDLAAREPRCVADILRLCGQESAKLDFADPFARSILDYQTVTGGIKDSVTELFGQAVDHNKPHRDLESLTEEQKRLSAEYLPGLVSAFYRDLTPIKQRM